jgi:transcription factor E
MQINLLKQLVEKMAGPLAVPIVEILYGKKDVNEFLIAKKMDFTINQVRNILYKLSAEGLVSFIRKKDKRKGWYIYFWTLNTYKCLIKVEIEILNSIQKLKEELKDRETKRFYSCKGCNIELNEEKALEHDFACEECAELYEVSDCSEIIKDLTNKIIRKERDLKNVKMEIESVEKEEEKKKATKQKKLDKEKQLEKEEKKKKRKKEKDNLKKIAKPKKVIKKKITKKVVKKKPKKVLKKKVSKKKINKKVVKKKPKKKITKKVKSIIKKIKKRK